MRWLIPLIIIAGVTMPNPIVHNPRYEIVTPDGFTFQFAPPDYAVDIGFFDGGDLPPIQHQTQLLYKQPGALLQSISIQPRVVTITAVINAKTRTQLAELRARLWKALRWNRTLTDPPTASVFRFTFNERVRELNVFLLSETTQDVGAEETKQNAVVRLIAYDPLWYGEATNSEDLLTQTSFTAAYIAGKESGLWSSLGGGANGTIYEIAKAPNGNIYAVGAFTTIGGVSANRVAYWDGTAWNALGTGLNAPGWVIGFTPNGDAYIGGEFTLAGGIAGTAYIARWNGSAWSALGSGLGGVPITTLVCRGLTVTPNGNVYVSGDFTTAGGGAANHVAKWDGSAWSALGTGFNAAGRKLVSDPSGNVYATGEFTTAGGTTVNYVGKWNGSAWSALGSGLGGGFGYAVALGRDGSLYVGGAFTTAGGIAANSIAKWNGSVWSPLSTGFDALVIDLSIDSDGILYVSGAFTTAGGLLLADRVAMWNGTTWSQLDIDLAGTPIVYSILSVNGNIYIGFDTTGTATVSGSVTDVHAAGDVQAYPVFTLTGPGTLQWIENTDSSKTMTFNLYVNAGETVTINLTAGNKSITSDSRGNLFPYTPLIPSSDFASWALEPDPIATDGDNTVALMITGTTPVEQNDDNTQLSGFANITGITPTNTDDGGKLYVSIVSQGGGFWSVNLYDDSARTHRVGYTASYNTNGAKTILPDNASGLGGTITVDARTAADSDIVVFFATAKVEWRDAYLSIDEGM